MSIVSGFNYLPDNLTKPIDKYNKLSMEYKYIEEVTDYEQNYIPTMTANTTGDFVASCSGYYKEGYEAYLAFDGNASTYWQRDGFSSSFTAGSWLAIKLDKAILIKEMTITRGTGYGYVTQFKIQQSIDGANWIDVKTISMDASTITIDLSNENLKTQRIRIYPTAMGGSSDSFVPQIKELQITKYAIITERYEYVGNLSLPIKSYSTDGIVNIKGSDIIVDGWAEGDIIPKVWTKTEGTDEITSPVPYISEDGTKITASDIIQTTSNHINRAFDGDDSTYHTTATSAAHWIKIQFPLQRNIKKMKVVFKPTQGLSLTFKIQGSNDDSGWTDLYSKASTSYSSSSATTIEANLLEGLYKYYRVYISSSTTHNLYFYEWQVLQYYGKVNITQFDNPYLDINNIGMRQIIGTIKANKYYQLVYDGIVWHPVLINVGVTGDPIIFTTSGTYTIDNDLTYNIVVIGGGGGGGKYVMNTGNTARGGGGGKVEGTYIPTSSEISVVVGAAGANGSGVYEVGKGTAGGDSSLETFIAEGGTGGQADYETDVLGTTGAGGDVAGFEIAGAIYGRAGDGGSVSPTQGVVILYPIV